MFRFKFYTNHNTGLDQKFSTSTKGLPNLRSKLIVSLIYYLRVYLSMYTRLFLCLPSRVQLILISTNSYSRWDFGLILMEMSANRSIKKHLKTFLMQSISNFPLFSTCHRACLPVLQVTILIETGARMPMLTTRPMPHQTSLAM